MNGRGGAEQFIFINITELLRFATPMSRKAHRTLVNLNISFTVLIILSTLFIVLDFFAFLRETFKRWMVLITFVLNKFKSIHLAYSINMKFIAERRFLDSSEKPYAWSPNLSTLQNITRFVGRFTWLWFQVDVRWVFTKH